MAASLRANSVMGAPYPAPMRVVVRDWSEQFERAGHLAPGWVKQARAALGPNVGIEPPRSGRLE
jgi:hypothetical protein